MNILVIGNSVEDYILYRGSNQNVKPGGIFYSCSAFSSLKNETDKIYLMSALQKDRFSLFEFIYNNLNLDLVDWIDNIPRIHLQVFDNKERHEKYENITNSLNLKIEDFSLYDGVYVNMITGFDITLDTAKEMRQKFNGTTFLDIHSLARGMDDNYVRDFRQIPNFNEWASCFDIMQANENEILTFSGLTDELKIAELTLALGTRILIVTKGDKGVTAYYKHDGEIRNLHLDATTVSTKNRIGCGDIFGASFFYNYLISNNLEHSLNIANIAAGLIASYDNLEHLINLKTDILHYGKN